jgi:hypothetical protein
VRHILRGAQVQAKLRIGAVNDPAEREADRVADQVMRMPDAALVTKSSVAQGTVQRLCAECEDELQRKAASGSGSARGLVAPAANAAIRSLGGGTPLPASERAFFEPRFGLSFDDVRVHTDAKAAEAAQAVDALAYTVGRDVVFAADQYTPRTSSGRRLLAHELTHAVQQSPSDRSGNEQISLRHSAPTQSVQRQAGTPHRFVAEGVSVVVRQGCEATLGYGTVEAAARTALDQFFNTECIEESRRTRIQRNLTRHGLDIRCAALDDACAEATGYNIPANILTLNTDRTDCITLENSILHEIIHLTRGVYEQTLPFSCEHSCFGTDRGVPPDLCRDIDVSGRRVRGGP